VYADETIIEDTFVSTTLVNSSKMTLAGMDVGKTLSEYLTRLNVLDSYLKTANTAHYYKYYFGFSMEDGGWARESSGQFSYMFYPYGLATHKIRNNWYAFVSGYSDDAITVCVITTNTFAREYCLFCFDLILLFVCFINSR
jgi:hypothetical protein